LALTKSDIPELLLPGLKAEFSLAYRNEVDNDLIARLATTINTIQPIQKYAILGNAPAMREFGDERRPQGITSASTSIEDKVFEATLSIDRRAIEDDQLELICLRVRDLASRVALHRHQLIVHYLENGLNNIGYDGQGIFSLSHPSRNGSVANVASLAMTSDGLKSGISAMTQFKDDEGIPLGIMPDTLLVGSSNMWKALELVESPGAILSNGEGSVGKLNEFNGRLKVVVSPFISSDTWFLLDTKRSMKAVILQQRSDVPVELTSLDNTSGSEAAFMRDRFMYGVRARYNVGAGMWQTAFCSSQEVA
jgi:phage major head subunit gpT-like protein